MAFERLVPNIITVCPDCAYFNEYDRLDDQAVSADKHATSKHQHKIAAAGWPYGTEFIAGCGRDCPDHGIAAYDGDEDAYEAAKYQDGPEPWHSSESCDECGEWTAGTREHATVYTYR